MQSPARACGPVSSILGFECTSSSAHDKMGRYIIAKLAEAGLAISHKDHG
jgi:hypothetical protein